MQVLENIPTQPPPAGASDPRTRSRAAIRKRSRRQRQSRSAGLRNRAQHTPEPTAPSERWGRMLVWVPPATLLAGLVLITLYALRPISDPDIWWHLKTGEIIVETGQIPRVDVYSHTAAGKPWVAHEWLSQVIFHFSTKPFGLNGLRALNAGMAIVLLLLLWRRCRQACANPLVATAVWAACVTLCMPYMTWRPQIFSIPILILLLPRILFPARACYSAGRLLLLIAGFWVWANLHSMVVLGVALLGVSWLAVCITHFIRDPSRQHSDNATERQLPLLMGIQLAAVALAVCLTPNGMGVYWYASVGAWVSSHSDLQIVEWLPGASDLWGLVRYRLVEFNLHDLGVRDLQVAILLTVIGATLVATVTAIRIDARRSPVPLALALVSVIAAIESRRAAWLCVVAIFAIVSFWGLSGYTTGRMRLPRLRGGATAVAILIVALAVPAWARAVPWTQATSMRTPVREAEYPVGLARFIADAGLEGNLAHSFRWGGYLVYRLSPRCRVFLHGEVPMYETTARSAVQDYLRLRNQREHVDEILRRYHVDLCIVEAHRPSERRSWLCTHLAEAELAATRPFETEAGALYAGWMRVVANREGAVYINTRSPSGRANLERCRRFYAARGITLSARGVDVEEILRTAPDLASTYGVVGLQFANDNDRARDATPLASALRLGDTYLRLGLATKAERAFSDALHEAPNDLSALIGAIDAAYERSQFSRARLLLRRAHRLRREDPRLAVLDRQLAYVPPSRPEAQPRTQERSLSDVMPELPLPVLWANFESGSGPDGDIGHPPRR